MTTKYDRRETNTECKEHETEKKTNESDWNEHFCSYLIQIWIEDSVSPLFSLFLFLFTNNEYGNGISSNPLKFITSQMHIVFFFYLSLRIFYSLCAFSIFSDFFLLSFYIFSLILVVLLSICANIVVIIETL